MNIKSTGFKVAGNNNTLYLTDIPRKDDNGNLDGSKMGDIAIVREDLTTGNKVVVVKSAGTVDYGKGEVILTTINITSTSRINNIVEIQAFPESNDVVGLKDLYLSFSVSNSTINISQVGNIDPRGVNYDYRYLGDTWGSARVFRMPNDGAGDNAIADDLYVAAMPGGYGVGSIDVYRNGVKLNGGNYKFFWIDEQQES